MITRAVGVTLLASLTVIGAMTAVGAQPVSTEQPTTARLLPLLNALAGDSVAQAIGSPDTPYESAPAVQEIPAGRDGEPAQAERSSRVVEGRLASEVIVTVGDARATATVKSDLCPDRGGVVKGTVAISISTGAGVDAQEHTATATFSGTADDAANLTSRSVSAPGVSGAERRALQRFAQQQLQTAEQAWRRGYCVWIEVLEGASRKVKPRETVPIRAKARHRFDGSTIDRPMSARLSGAKKVTPESSAASPAAFTYTGPERSPGRGDVTLRSVSRRGIATERLRYAAGGDLKIDEAVGPARITGLKCGGPVGPWSLHVVADFGPVKSDETVQFALGEDLTGPVTAGGTAFGPPGGVGTEGAASASYDPIGKLLTISPGGSVRVTEGDFCE